MCFSEFRSSAVALMASLMLLGAGCSSPPPPVPPPPVVQASLPPSPLLPDQLAKLKGVAPDTAQRVQSAQPLSLDDVKALAKAGFDSDSIIAVVRNSQTIYHLSADQIIDLTHAGVNSQVIAYMESTPNSVVASSPPPDAGPDVATNTPPPGQVPPPPPADANAEPPPSPGADYVWVGGDWVWNGGWVWAPGRWVLPPYPHAVWVHGRWGYGYGWRGGYRRHPGYWR